MTDRLERAILHVDGDAFFVACEVACNPSLIGKPVVTGEERRIVSAMSYEAKSLGVKRGMPIHEVRKYFPQVIIVSSHYKLYEIFSRRMVRIVERFTPTVEWYSIDECFADLTGTDIGRGISYVEIASLIKKTLLDELGLNFSVGLSTTKCLAKVASRLSKPNGLTVIYPKDIKTTLKDFEIGRVWGIGRQTSIFLSQLGISNALDFINKDRSWVELNCGKNVLDIWYELSGVSVNRVSSGYRELHKSFSSTETFMSLSSDPAFILSELSRHSEKVASKARREALSARHISFFIKTADFRYRRIDSVLDSPSALPNDFIKMINRSFSSVFDPSLRYRASGVTIFDLVPSSCVTQELFAQNSGVSKFSEAFSVVDQLARTHGRRAVQICSSLVSSGSRKPAGRNLSIPILGKVS